MTTPLLDEDDELTELVDADFPRVDLVGKAANGIPRFVIAKEAAGGGLLDPAFVRSLVAKAGDDADDRAKAEKKALKAAKKAAKKTRKKAARRAELDAARRAAAPRPARTVPVRQQPAPVVKTRAPALSAAEVAARTAQAVRKADQASAAMMAAVGIDVAEVRKARMLAELRQAAAEPDERWLARKRAGETAVVKAAEERREVAARAAGLKRQMRTGTAAEQNNAALQMNAMAVEALAAARRGGPVARR